MGNRQRDRLPRGTCQRATEIAHELAGYSPIALRVTKRVLDAGIDAPRETALLLEQLAYAVLNEAG